MAYFLSTRFALLKGVKADFTLKSIREISRYPWENLRQGLPLLVL